MIMSFHTPEFTFHDAEQSAITRHFHPLLAAIDPEIDSLRLVRCLAHAAWQGSDWRNAPEAAGQLAKLEHAIHELSSAGALETLALELERHSDELAKASLHWTSRRLQLVTACERAYSTFKSYPLDQFLRAIACDTSEAFPRNVRQLSPSTALRHFSFGDHPMMRAVVPRALELMAFDQMEDGYPEGIHSYLKESPWWEWPTAEREAIQNYIETCWRGLLSRYPGKMWGYDSFIAVRNFFEVSRPALRNRLVTLWQNDPHLPATLHLATHVSELRHFCDRPQSRESAGATAHPAFVQWCSSHNARLRLESAYLQHSDAAYAPRLAEAADYSAWLCRQKG
jgi:hypothetical protein